MSGEVVGWAFKRPDLSPTQKLVLVAIADNAQDDGMAFPGKKLLVRKTGLGQSTVYRALDELEEKGCLSKGEDDRGVECYWLSVPEREENSQSGKSNSQSGKTLIEEPSVEPSKKQRRVNKKLVSDSELSLAAAVVQLFNSSAGTELSVDAHLTPIVGRIRERPAYTEEHHRRIIEAVFAGEHWWTGPPTPKVIYGNPSIFEQSIELARARMKERAKSESDPNAERERVRREFREAEEEDAAG